MTTPKVIVFGPTGAVGSVAARTAEELGASVVLAMRDPSKTIPGLDPEKSTKFEKVQADLFKPDTVRDAVTSTGAKRAFLYYAHGSASGMRSTVEALREGGIELVVFLSSYTVRGDLKAIPDSDIIPKVHAEVELDLEDVFGRDSFVALRPGWFASNNVEYKSNVQKGEIKLFRPDATIDCIVPADIGRVAGTILAKGPQDEQRIIYLYGPQLLPQEEVLKTIADVVGKTIEVKAVPREHAIEFLMEERKLPEIFARYLVKYFEKASPPRREVFAYSLTEEEQSNIMKYSGTEATPFRQWLEENKQKFMS